MPHEHHSPEAQSTPGNPGPAAHDAPTTHGHLVYPDHGHASTHGQPGHGHASAHGHASTHGDASAHGHAAAHGHSPGHGHGFSQEMTEMLDLDAEVAAAHLTELTARVAQLLGDHPVRDVIDIGTGTGTGSFALLRRFPEATVTAIDTSPEMLSHLAESARRNGFEHRVHPMRADLDTGWPRTGPADLVWAAASMHHMGDPDRVLADIRTTLRPGGLLAMIEMETLPRFLPDDIGIGRPGLEARCNAIADRARAEHLPHVGSDWPSRLSAAGFKILDAHDLVVDLSAPLPATAVRYAVATLRRFRAGVGDRLPADDLTTLDRLLADDGHLLRTIPDLKVHSTRAVWLATPA